MAYTTIDDPSAYFHTQLYTGTGSTNAITNDANVNLQPDWVWIKKRAGGTARSHGLYDSSRGVTKLLHSDAGDAEQTQSQGLTAFGTDGFTLGSDDGVNGNTHSYVAWQWKSQGGSTVSNTDGSITSTVQANTTAGFSIVTYTGAASGSSSFTIGHGLGAVPNWIVIKNRSTATNWQVYHSGLTSGSDGPEHCGVRLNTTDAVNNSDTFWADTLPTSSVFTVRESDNVNKNGDSLVAYCFAEKQGYSKFGSFTGNGNADGAFVYTGFKPRWIMWKGTDLAENWIIIDTKRDPHNLSFHRLDAERNNAESTSTASHSAILDILSNGFKMRGSGDVSNGSGHQYIYMAFGETFVSSEGVPTTAR
jgi:hypothetical protein